MLKPNDKILIVRLSALGDCIHTLPLAKALKEKFPGVFIGWAVEDRFKYLIENNPVADKVHVMPKSKWKKSKNHLKNLWEFINYIREIRKEGYTIAIDSQELFKSAIISFLSGAQTRLAHDKSREFAHLFANERLEAIPIFDTSRHVIERNMDFARALGIEEPETSFCLPDASQDDKDYAKELLKEIDPTLKTIVIAPSTTWTTKHWAIENWVKVIDSLQNKANVVISAGKGDNAYITDIISKCRNNNIINLTGETTILQLKEVFSRADIVITPDSGSAHLAAAVEKPVVICLFGSTSAVRNAAYGAKNINISLDLPCQPCYKKKCKTSSVRCLTNLMPAAVIDKVFGLIEVKN
ncbi:MAG: glycosyltransferase family 9 protein [Candidatus Gastranaerophilales bacterium]|nr:glycosyltransferase family 9 protein [Candidatus Gastranaerophilales bacterium]